jgi:hypothetical protein
MFCYPSWDGELEAGAAGLPNHIRRHGPSALILALAIVGAFLLLYAPNEFLGHLPFGLLLKQYRLSLESRREEMSWFSPRDLYLIVCAGLALALWLCTAVVRAAISDLGQRRRLDGLRHAIASLDQDEIAVLREFYLQSRDSIVVPMVRPCVGQLLDKGLLEIAGSLEQPQSTSGLLCVKLARVASDLLQAKDIGVPEGEPRTDGRS